MMHSYSELRALMGERLRLLECNVPVDAAAFHKRIVSLLLERIELLELCKLGRRSAPA